MHFTTCMDRRSDYFSDLNFSAWPICEYFHASVIHDGHVGLAQHIVTLICGPGHIMFSGSSPLEFWRESIPLDSINDMERDGSERTSSHFKLRTGRAGTEGTRRTFKRTGGWWISDFLYLQTVRTSNTICFPTQFACTIPNLKAMSYYFIRYCALFLCRHCLIERYQHHEAGRWKL